MYKALIEANVSETTATQAAQEIDEYKRDVIELKTSVRIIIGLLVAVLVVLIAPLIGQSDIIQAPAVSDFSVPECRRR